MNGVLCQGMKMGPRPPDPQPRTPNPDTPFSRETRCSELTDGDESRDGASGPNCQLLTANCSLFSAEVAT